MRRFLIFAAKYASLFKTYRRTTSLVMFIHEHQNWTNFRWELIEDYELNYPLIIKKNDSFFYTFDFFCIFASEGNEDEFFGLPSAAENYAEKA